MNKNHNASDWRSISEPPAFGSYDQPLSEPIPPTKLLGLNICSNNEQLTLTGWICCLVPWIFLIWKRLKWGLFDLLVLVASCGSVLGIAIRTMEAKKLKWLPALGYLYLIAHLYAVFFCWILYTQRFEYSWNRGSAFKQYWVKLFIFGGVTLILSQLLRVFR